MPRDRPIQLRLRTALGIVALVCLLLGAIRLPPVIAAHVLTYVVVLTFVAVTLGAVVTDGRAKLACLGAALGLGVMLLLKAGGDKSLGVDWLLDKGWADVLMRVNGQEAWTRADVDALGSMLASVTTLALGGLGAVIGLMMSRRARRI